MNHYIKSIVEGFDFNNIDNSSKNKNLAKSAINLIIKKYSDDIKNKILNHVKLNSDEMQLLDTYAPEFRKQMKIKIDELLPLIIYHLVDNKADNLDWIDLGKFCKENEFEMSPQGKFILTYIPTQEDIIKVKKFLQTIQELESHRDTRIQEERYSFLTLCILPYDEDGDILTRWEWGQQGNKFIEKFKDLSLKSSGDFDGNYTVTEFLENQYLLCLLIKQLVLANNKKLFTSKKGIGKEAKITHHIIAIGYHLCNNMDLEDIYKNLLKIKYIKNNFGMDNCFHIDPDDCPFVWVKDKDIKNLDDALDKLIIFSKEYINQCNLYAKEIDVDEDEDEL